MKKLLLMVFATSVSLLGGSIIVNENGESGAGIYKVSDNGSEYTLIESIDFQFSQVKRTKGVKAVVSAGMKPISIHSSFIHQIQFQEDAQGYVQINQGRFQPGDLVNIQEGALKGLQGLFHCSLDDQRTMLLVHLLGNMQRIEVGLNEIERHIA